MHRRLYVLTPLATAVLALAACSGSDSDPDSDPAASESSSPSRSISPSASPSPSPSPSVTPGRTADGSDYSACHDGECEVLVTDDVDIAMDPRLAPEISQVSVRISPNTVGISCDSPRLASCAASYFFLAPGDTFAFTTSVGFRIDMQWFEGSQVIAAFSIES